MCMLKELVSVASLDQYLAVIASFWVDACSKEAGFKLMKIESKKIP